MAGWRVGGAYVVELAELGVVFVFYGGLVDEEHVEMHGPKDARRDGHQRVDKERHDHPCREVVHLSRHTEVGWVGAVCEEGRDWPAVATGRTSGSVVSTRNKEERAV